MTATGPSHRAGSLGACLRPSCSATLPRGPHSQLCWACLTRSLCKTLPVTLSPAQVPHPVSCDTRHCLSTLPDQKQRPPAVCPWPGLLITGHLVSVLRSEGGQALSVPKQAGWGHLEGDNPRQTPSRFPGGPSVLWLQTPLKQSSTTLRHSDGDRDVLPGLPRAARPAGSSEQGLVTSTLLPKEPELLALGT